MKAHKRLLSLLLTAVLLTATMVFSGGNVYAKAATVTNEAEFLLALGDSSVDTITVTGDIRLQDQTAIDRALTIKGNGKIVTENLIVGTSGNLTVTESLNIESVDNAIYIEGGTFTLSGNATVNASDGVGVVALDFAGNRSAINVQGGSVYGGLNAISAFYSDINVTGGTITGTSCGLALFSETKAKITGGTVHATGTSSEEAAILSDSSYIYISGTADISASTALATNLTSITIERTPSLKLSGSVYGVKEDGENIATYLTQLPKPVTAQAGKTQSFSIVGADSGVKYKLSNPPSALKASISSNKVTLSPTKAGNYTLNLYYELSEGSSIRLILPVTVNAASGTGSSGGTSSNTTSRPENPETGALPMLPMLVFFGFAALAAVGTIGYKAYAKRSR